MTIRNLKNGKAGSILARCLPRGCWDETDLQIRGFTMPENGGSQMVPSKPDQNISIRLRLVRFGLLFFFALGPGNGYNIYKNTSKPVRTGKLKPARRSKNRKTETEI
jgi:hypothetical protein